MKFGAKLSTNWKQFCINLDRHGTIVIIKKGGSWKKWEAELSREFQRRKGRPGKGRRIVSTFLRILIRGKVAKTRLSFHDRGKEDDKKSEAIFGAVYLLRFGNPKDKKKKKKKKNRNNTADGGIISQRNIHYPVRTISFVLNLWINRLPRLERRLYTHWNCYILHTRLFSPIWHGNIFRSNFQTEHIAKRCTR